MTFRVALRCCQVAVALIIAAAVSLAVSPARAADVASRPAIQQLSLGFAGRYKVGYWTPVEATLAGGSTEQRADLRIIVPDGDGVPSEVVEHDVLLQPGQTTVVRTYVKFGRPQAAIRVTLGIADDPAALADRTFSGDEVPKALPATQRLIVVFGTPLDLAGAAKLVAAEGSPAAEIAYLDRAEQLPDRWYGYEGVDLVVLTTGKPEMFRPFPEPADAALQRWVELGGRLLLSVASAADELLKPAGQLARFAPGRFVAVRDLRRFGALENFAGTAERFDAAGVQPGERLTVEAAQLADVTGRIEASEDELPLIVRRAVGLGQTVFVAVDIDSAAFRRWSARAQFLALLLDRNATTSGEGVHSTAAGQGAQWGFDDLSGQLRAALDQFPDVRVTPFWLIATLATAYVLLLFPADYWLGRRMGRGPAGPWLRLAGIVAASAVGVWLLARHNRSGGLQANQVNVVDLDEKLHVARGSSWFSVYSPRNELYTLAVEPHWLGPHTARTETNTSWFGLPGTSLGGMEAKTAELPLFDRPYPCNATADALGPTPLAAWSSRCYTSRWVNKDARLVESALYENADHQLAGTIRLAAGQGSDKVSRPSPLAPRPSGAAGQGGGTPLELTDCVLYYDRWAYVIPGRFTVAAPLDIEGLAARTAETLLTRRKIVGGADETVPYDRSSLDRARILEMMMFFRAAGGRQYTGLSDRYQQFVDLSDLLTLDRAILVGLGPPAATLMVDGQPLPAAATVPPVTYYRFILPVRKRGPVP